MSTQNSLGNQQIAWLSIESRRMRKRPSLLMRLAILFSLSTLLLICGVMLLARAQPVPQLSKLNLPQAYLPGGPMPEDNVCSANTPHETTATCLISFQGSEIVFKYDLYRDVILLTSIQTYGDTIGELIAAWGTPTGMMQTYYMTAVHWGTRAAYVYSDSFRPDSPVRLIYYELEPPRTTPWRGFRRYRNNPPTG